MKYSSIILSGLFAAALAGCSAPSSSSEPAAEPSNVSAAEEAYRIAPVGVYTNDKTHAYITFSYLHQGYSKPFLRWRDWDSTLNWNANSPSASKVSVNIKTASIDTGVDIFDEHLREEKWFDAAGHPEITFVSTALKKTSDTDGIMTGELTIKGITKPVTLDVKFNKAGEGRAPGSFKIGFSATGDVKRSDWGLGAYVPHVGDNINLMIEVEYGMTMTPK